VPSAAGPGALRRSSVLPRSACQYNQGPICSGGGSGVCSGACVGGGCGGSVACGGCSRACISCINCCCSAGTPSRFNMALEYASSACKCCASIGEGDSIHLYSSKRLSQPRVCSCWGATGGRGCGRSSWLGAGDGKVPLALGPRRVTKLCSKLRKRAWRMVGRVSAGMAPDSRVGPVFWHYSPPCFLSDLRQRFKI